MNTLHKNFLLSEDREFLTKFIGMLQKRGNKQRALTTVFGVLSLLKMGINGAPIWSDFPLHTLDEQNPLKIIHRSLYHLQPAFLLRRVIRSGRRYDLPVPISPKRATFFAIDWLRKTALKHNKNDASFHFLLASEISLALYQQGSSKDFLKSYIDIALDQRPFGRFIKKKRKAISKIKGRPTSPRLLKYNAHIRRSMKIRQYRAKGLIRKINKHNIHSAFLESGQKFTERRNKKGFIIKRKKTFKAKKVTKIKTPNKKSPIKLNKRK